MTPETKAKKKLQKELQYLAESLNLPCSYVANPASEFSEIGRCDADVIINNVLYLHVEVKAAGNDKPDPAQAVFMHSYDYGKWCFTVTGEEGVDAFMDHLRHNLIHMVHITVADLKYLGKTFNANHGDYFQKRAKRQRIAARQPKRQSAGVPKSMGRGKKSRQ